MQVGGPLTGVKEDVAWLLDRAATYLHSRGEPGPARPLRERAWDLRRSTLGEDHPDTLDSASNLALDLWEVGHYEQSRQLSEDTLTRERRILGAGHPHALRLAHDLAAALTSLDEHDQAPRWDE